VIVLDAFTALLVTTIGGWWLHGAVRMWRGGARFSSSPLFRVQSHRRREHIDRCAPAVAGLILCVDLVLIGVLLSPDSKGGSGQSTDDPLSLVAGLAYLGAVVFTVCALGIRYFNRPRFLVPPPLRATSL
jgi:hypothetical protein